MAKGASDADARLPHLADLPDDAQARRRLRAAPGLTAAMADRLIAVEADARSRQRDASMVRAVRTASLAVVQAQAGHLAAGSAAAALWERLADDPPQRLRLARAVVGAADLQAAEATLHLLVLDPLDAFQVGAERMQVALVALDSPLSAVRSLAMEFLVSHGDAGLHAVRAQADVLVRDADAQVRGLAWRVALRHDSDALGLAFALANDEAEALPARRSALVALGDAMSTADIAPVLAWFVRHPQAELASDAAALLTNQHKHPDAAEAALHSPHATVRDQAAALMDPLRGSPAAGGSRDAAVDMYAQLVRQLEDAQPPAITPPRSDA